MKLKELIESRYSVRAYLSRPIEKEKIDYILDCARLAPSACNNQPWKIFVIQNISVLESIRKAYDREWFKSAPVHLVVCKDSSLSWKRKATDNKDFGDVDAAIAAEHICLAAAETGLGTCWVCNFDLQMLTEILNLPEHIEAIAIFPLGYIDPDKSSFADKKRKGLTEIVEWV